MTTAMIIFVVISVISVLWSVAFDGYMINLYKQNAALLAGIRLCGTLLFQSCFDVVVAYKDTSFFTYPFYPVVGITVVLGITSLWVLPMDECKPKPMPLHQILLDCLHQLLPLLLVFLAFLAGSYSQSMAHSLVTVLFPNDEHRASVLSGFSSLTQWAVLSFAWAFYYPFAYRFLLPCSFGLQIFATLFLMFLKSSQSAALIYAFVLCHAFFSALAASVIQTFCLDAAAHTSSATFLYSLHTSLLNFGGWLGTQYFPLLLPHISWMQYWYIDLGIIVGVLAFVIGLLVSVARACCPAMNREETRMVMISSGPSVKVDLCSSFSFAFLLSCFSSTRPDQGSAAPGSGPPGAPSSSLLLSARPAPPLAADALVSPPPAAGFSPSQSVCAPLKYPRRQRNLSSSSVGSSPGSGSRN